MSEKRYGHLLEHWNAARDEARAILVQCARDRQTITYGELAERIRAARIEPHSYGMVGLLTEIAREDTAAGRPVLVTLVVRQSDGLPGPGYFREALEHGADRDNLRGLWEARLRELCDYYAE